MPLLVRSIIGAPNGASRPEHDDIVIIVMANYERLVGIRAATMAMTTAGGNLVLQTSTRKAPHWRG